MITTRDDVDLFSAHPDERAALAAHLCQHCHETLGEAAGYLNETSEYMMDRRAWAGALLPMITGSLWHVTRRPSRPARYAGVSPLAALTCRRTRTGTEVPGIHQASGPSQHDTDGGSPHGGRGEAVPLGCFMSALAFPVLCAAFDLDAPMRRMAPAPALLALVILLRRMTAPLPNDVTHGPTVHPRAAL